jgi:phosphoribosylamine--glycine ligase
MRILVISKEGDALGVAHRLTAEGNAVSLWVKDPRYRRALTGIVPRVADWRRAVGTSDLVLTDMVGMGRMAKEFRGVPFIGANEYVDRVELDRQVGTDLFKRAGIKVPETLAFTSPGKVELPPPWGLGWVIKPCGNKDTSKTLVVEHEELWDHCISKTPQGPLIAQRIVEGVEVSTEGWFNGRSFATLYNHTFEEKRFLPGGLGPQTGCMGNVVVATESNRLTKATVEKVAPFLRMTGYRGPFDINCIVNEEGAWALEATGRMGYDAIEALAEGLDEPLGDVLFECAAGVLRTLAVSSDWLIAVRLSVPPWPVQKPDTNSYGEPVLGIDDDTLPHLFLTDVYAKGEGYATAAGDGILLKATARSPTLHLAQRKVYRLLEKISVGSKQYRNDIGDRVSEDMDRLRGWGWVS